MCLLLSKNSAKSSIAQAGRLTSSPDWLHVYEVNGVCLNNNPPLSVEFSTRDEALAVAQGAHYHVDAIYLLP